MEENAVGEKDNTPYGIVTEAKERYDYAVEAYGRSRQQAVEDTRFAMGDSDNGWQWPADIAEARRGDKRVCLTVNLTAQHCNQIINQIRQNRPTGRVLPVDDGADKKTAEILEGLIRNIQSSSAADDAHDIAAEHSVYGGEGFWRIITEYEAEDSFNQVIRIKPCNNPQLVFVDPDAIEPDKSDAEWGFVFEDVKKETFARENPGIDPSSWQIDTKSQWVTEDTFRQAEYFYVEYIKDKALLLADGSTILESNLDEGVTRIGMTLANATGMTIAILKERDTERKQWKYCKLVGGHDKPIDLQDWPGAYLPIISVVGKEVNVNGEIVRKGIVRDLKDPARMVNYSYSETVQTLALQNKVPYMAAAEAIEGYETIWKSSNLENRAYLPYNAFDDENRPLPVPQRQPPPVMPQAQVQLLQLSTEEMRGASGQQNANFGIRSEASSGVGIQRLKAQGEIATFHFPDNLARGLRYELKVIIDLIQKIYDTRRVVRILGLDGKQDMAILDPDNPQPYTEATINNQDIQRIFNPSVGRYDVVIDTGPSFQTQRQEAFATMTDMVTRNPALMGLAGDLIIRNGDFPGADKIADRLAKALPPNLQDQKGGAEQQLAQLAGQMQQAQQQMQIMAKQLQEAQMKVQQAESGMMKTQAEIQGKIQIAGLEQQLIERKFQLEMQAKKEMALIEAQLKREMAVIEGQIQANAKQADIINDAVKTEAELKSKREQAGIDAAVTIATSHQDNCAAVEIEQMKNDTVMEKAELEAMVKLEIANKQNPELKADVQEDFKEED